MNTICANSPTSPVISTQKKKPVTKAPISGIKSPLKWAGGKRKLIHDIDKLIPIANKRQRLIEPFVGGGSVFLNLTFEKYLLVDSNPDLIALFSDIKNRRDDFLKAANALFTPQHNQSQKYYDLRSEFNVTPPSLRRSVLFLYLNRHGYNGLCRYNLKGGYNVPFGQYKKPYFPNAEIMHFANKASTAELAAGDFSIAFNKAAPGDIVYCDPPYTPINQTSNFTAYSGKGFSEHDQQRLVECALAAQQNGVTSIVSNHYLPVTKKLYASADKIIRLNVSRTISCKGKVRKPCAELMAIYKAHP